MAEDTSKDKPKTSVKKLSKKKTQTVRQRAEAKSAKGEPRIRKTATKLSKPVAKARQVGKKEYHLPLPDNKAGRVLKKRVRIFPKFFVEAFKEVRQVTWPDFRSSVRMTIAVFLFAVIFAAIVGVLDFFLGEIFKRLFVK